jgi:hypothetical protein
MVGQRHFPFSFSRLCFRAEQRSISIRTQEKRQVAGFSLGCNVDIGLRNFVCLTFEARPSHRLAALISSELPEPLTGRLSEGHDGVQLDQIG